METLAIVLEGKYWKRRLDTVTHEYKRWRKFFKSKFARSKPDPSLSEVMSHAELLDRLRDVHQIPYNTQHSSATDLMLENMDIDFTQDFFSQLNQSQPFAFPTSKEFTGFGIADLTQPGLLSLQPTLEDFPMDTFDLQDMIQFSQSQPLTNNVIQFTGNSSQEPDNLRFQMPVQQDIEMKPDLLQGQTNAEGQMNISGLNLINLLLTGDASQQSSQIQINNTQTILNQFLQQQGQQLIPDQNQPAIVISDNSSARLSGGQGQAKETTLSTLQAALSGNLSNKKTKDKNSMVTVTPATSILSNKTGGTGATSKRQTKKDGFVVPQGKPVTVRSKSTMRTIAPAPVVQKTSYSALEELLKTGTYPGAVISVKNEGNKASATYVSSTPVKPIKPALSSPALSSAIDKQTLPVSSDTPVKSIKPALSSPALSTTIDKQTLPTVKTDSHLLKAISTDDSEMTSILSSIGKPTFHINTSLSADIPLSPVSSAGSPIQSIDNPLDTSLGSPTGYNKDKEAIHRSSEQKRRFNIKHGFDTLHVLIPAIMQNSNAKISKAAMLQKTAEYCKKLKQERAQMHNEAEILRNEIETLNNAIGQCQAQLPATGVPVTRQRADQLKKMFDEYVKNRTLTNWKFWIFSKIIAHLFDTFNAMVSTSSTEELCRTTLSWLDQHCSLVNLRPDVTNALTSLSTTTSILSDPSKLPEQATKAALNPKSEPR
ncbi:MAX-like protein X [Mytilus galloprovincialis]|uniref:MAX-like protein X n=1 Tax=Mytilus galloprovincialis TaxID=29158 RepID=A0A8B6BV80_MYTGA|nr:MAX-like protein X [Mytilus galloprovincialis]